ncbi:hypothetical protein HPB51_019829 [Rhipicephalus microplus]|uniref:Uncharacterized protein n=1 Tax=Rhipicephalus microplus TaxID=6941 RepID=A0A9J6DBY6_RHIMP|nr:hypothetical protein HPB51_019829 [Rhipicephalus microplus]
MPKPQEEKLDFVFDAVSVRVFEYPADASDHVLSRALEVYGKVQSISTDNLTGLRTTTGNRRARMKLRSPVPNITDVDGHVVRCEYDGVVRFCRKCMLPGHERKKCTTPRCARCKKWGHPTCDAPCKRCGGDHPPHLCKQRLYSEATTRSGVPQVEPPTVVSTEVQDAPAPTTSDKGNRAKPFRRHQEKPRCKKAERRSQDRSRPLSPLRKPAPRANTPMQAPKSRVSF